MESAAKARKEADSRKAVAPPNGLRCLFVEDVFMELTFPIMDLTGRQAAATSAGIVTVMKRLHYIHEKTSSAFLFLCVNHRQ